MDRTLTEERIRTDKLGFEYFNDHRFTYRSGWIWDRNEDLYVKLIPGEFVLNACVYGLLRNYDRFLGKGMYEDEESVLKKLERINISDSELKRYIEKLADRNVDGYRFTDDGGVIINISRYVKLLYVSALFYLAYSSTLKESGKKEVNDYLELILKNSINQSTTLRNREDLDEQIRNFAKNNGNYKNVAAKLGEFLFLASFIYKEADFPNYFSNRKNSYNSFWKYLIKLLSIIKIENLVTPNHRLKCYLTDLNFSSGLNDIDAENFSSGLNDIDAEQWLNYRYLTYRQFKIIDT
ncbi:MAG: hypothetical protein NZ908_02115, partial [Candidatus Micrarchaeota archaeon]|nr:hypothetical protein [Candidatus Micrarchaeota archaeon]